MKAFLSVIAAIAVLIVLPWLIMGQDFFLYRFFAPKYQAVQRQVFEQTPSYNKGMIQELTNMQYQYVQADFLHKVALSSLILLRVAEYEASDSQPRLPPNLQSFVSELRPKKLKQF